MNKIFLISLTVLVTLFFTKITFFVIPPFQGLTEGETKVMWRMDQTQFIDSPDAICQREINTVSKVCSTATTAAISLHEEIILRFGYSTILHKISMW